MRKMDSRKKESRLKQNLCILKILNNFTFKETMEYSKALKPFDGSTHGTVREKHNKFMNFILTIANQQRLQRETDQREVERQEQEIREKLEQEERDREDERRRLEEERLENIRLDRERREAEARHEAWRLSLQRESSSTQVNPLHISNDLKNSLIDGKFIGSIYVDNNNPDNWSDRFNQQGGSSWRVRL